MLSSTDIENLERACERAFREGRDDDAERIANLVSPRGLWFAWRPVRIFDRGWRWAWFERVRWVRVFGGPVEYWK